MVLVICYWEWRQIKVFGLLAKIFRQLEFLVQARMAIEVRSRTANNRQVLATTAEVWTTFNNSGSRVAALTGAMMRSEVVVEPELVWEWHTATGVGCSGRGNQSLSTVRAPTGCHTLVEENQCHQA